MRVSRRWTERDLQGLDDRKYGFVHVEPPALSVESARQVLEARRAMNQKLEAKFRQHLIWAGMGSVFETQVRFHPTRKWLFDFYAAPYKLAVEIHGGTFAQGYHTRGVGFDQDREKIHAAIELGITVLEFTSTSIDDGSGIALTERMLLTRGWVK